MKTESLARYGAEQRALLYTFAVAGVLLAVFGLLVAVQRSRLRAAVERMTRVSDEIRAVSAEFGMLPPDRVLTNENVRQEGLRREWETLRLKTDTFRRGSPFAEVLLLDEEGRIDFKVALFRARTRLQQTASSNNIAFPADLGIKGTIGTDEDAETRLWQLASVVKLVEECFELGVPSIESISTMPPVEHPLLEEEGTIALEFPIHIRINCSYPTLVELLGAIADDRCFLSLRHFCVEKVDQDAASLLTVDMVRGAILFKLRGKGDAVILPGGDPRDE